MRSIVLSLALLAGCYAPMGAHESMNPAAMIVGGVIELGNANDIRPVLRPTNGCLPIDYYVGGATFLIRKTDHGCEWISYSEGGTELARGVVALAEK